MHTKSKIAWESHVNTETKNGRNEEDTKLFFIIFSVIVLDNIPREIPN